jgi:hypothetical protein
MFARAGTGDIDGGDRAGGGADEAVVDVERVEIHSGDGAGGVDGRWEGSLILGGACAGSFEFRDGAAGGADEAVGDIVGDDVETGDGAGGVDADGDGALVGAGAGPGGAEGGEGLSLSRCG